MLLEYYILYRTNADNKQQYVLNRPVFFQEFVLILCGKARELLGDFSEKLLDAFLMSELRL